MLERDIGSLDSAGSRRRCLIRFYEKACIIYDRLFAEFAVIDSMAG